MATWPIGLSTGCFYRRSIFDCLNLIRESGFSLLEVCFSPTHLDYHDLASVRTAAHRIDDLGLEAYSFHAPFAPHIDISSLDGSTREAAFREIAQAAEAAAILGVHYFVLHPGPEMSAVPPREERLQRMENAVEILNRVAGRCRMLSIRCVLENKLPHLLFGKTCDVLWILDALDALDVGVCLDTGHAFLSGEFEHLVRKLMGHLKMLHIHDNRGRDDEHLAPGDGFIDWEMLLRELAQGHFQGAFILELAAAETPERTMENARRGRTFLRKLCRQIVLSPS
jgi:sugar phosphate isomerase/epimerase